MARSPSITLVLSLLMGIFTTVCPQECSEDPATSLVGQLVGLVGERAGRTCDVCSGGENGFPIVHPISLHVWHLGTDVKLEELRSEVAAMNLDAHNNLTAVAQQLRTEIEELKTMLENIQSFIKGGARTSRDAPSTCADNQVMLASMGYLAPVESGTYKNNTDCTWVIERPPGYKIKITWLMFALERCTDCKCDYVEIWDGNTTKELIGGKRYCGYLDPPTMTSTSNRVEIKFHSNDVRTYAGFKIKYESVED
ncbi:suppressor of tumorigenicity 14 protein-like [Penaeus japonicus]|uniref:suppressor of tumorigenicity 14 protein-like n=1 Tax=Penaeus japonicus TaxID=27405 RepID=UPI001C716FF2|nr:suppressor of tumorigenicity 14 protein-like [Penaeus japonicus]